MGNVEAERLQVAAQALNFGIWDWNLGTGDLHWTPELEAIYGLAPGAFDRTYADFSNRVYPQDLADVERCSDEAVAAGRSFDVDFRIVRADGELRWVRATGNAIRNASGKVQRIIGINIDITEQKRLQLDLAVKDARLRTVLKLTELVIWHQDTKLRYTWIANPALGFSPETLIGRSDSEIFSKEDAQKLGVIKRRVLCSGQGERQEVWVNHNGQTACFDLIVEPECADGGKVTGLVCAAADITHRKLAEEHLQLQADILQNIKEGVNIVDSQGILQFTNPKFDEMFGYAAGELVGQPVAVLNAQHSSDPSETAQAILEELACNGQWLGEIESRRKDGSEFWSKAHVVATRHPKLGKVWITVQSDITAFRQAEKERDAARFLIGQLSDHVQDRMEEQRREISREVHDQIGAALTGIRMQLLALSHTAESAAITPILDELDSVLQSTRDLYSALRPPILDDLGLAETLRWYVRDWAKKSGIKASLRIFEFASEPADPLRIDLFRMLQELLTNVARHSGAGRVHVSLRRTGAGFCLRVNDNGHGFDEGQTKGFGLIGIRERLRRHGGEMAIESSAQGTRITLTTRWPSA